MTFSGNFMPPRFGADAKPKDEPSLRCEGCGRWSVGDEPSGTSEDEVCMPHTSPDCWNLVYQDGDPED